MKKQTLWLELLLVYIIPPLLFISGLLPSSALMPVLWLLTFYAFIHLKNTKTRLLAFNFKKEDLFFVLLRFAFIAGAMILFVLLYKPDIFLILVKTKPLFWLGLIFLYPVLSAYLQEILFRAFFFKRYKKLFNNRPLNLIFLNALIFSYIHIVFLNWIAVLFTFIGGLLFAHTYLKTRSILLVSIEHSLYGNALYTIGLGYYFYHGGFNV